MMSNIQFIIISIILVIGLLLLYNIQQFLCAIISGGMTVQITVKELEEAVNDFEDSEDSEE